MSLNSDHIVDVMMYLLYTSDVSNNAQTHRVVDIIAEYLTQQSRENVMSIADRLIAEGIEKGIEKGLEQECVIF